ncbi:MAG: hypothetical protein ACHQ6T_12090 [Myxococcota bacterium]
MKIRVGLGLLAAAGAALLPSVGFAQTCTVGPFTAATPISSISSAINSAPDGAVICLKRGEVWSGSTGFAISKSHSATSRALICASDSTQCTASGAANPRFQLSSADALCFGWMPASGWNLQNVDCYGPTSTNTDAMAFRIDHGSHDITVSGGVSDTFFIGLFTNAGSGAPPTNIQFGTCAAPVEIRGNPSSFPGLRPAEYGPLVNSTISVNIHDFTGGNGGGQDHLLDLASNSDYTTGSNNLTIECSTFTYSGGNLGAFIKANRGQNGVIRDSTFQNVSGGCTTSPAIGFDSHNDPPVEGWIGMQIYRNRFINTHIQIGIGQNVEIYNNISTTCAADFSRGFVQIWYTADPEDLQVQNIHTYNNTIYFKGNSNQGNGYGLISENPPQFTGRVTATGLTLYNNLFYDLDGGDAKVWVMPHAGCSNYGANGVNIKNNFVYSPNDSSPQLWSGCSGASGTNAAPYNTNPGLVDPANGNFSLAKGSILAGTGVSAGSPSNGDFLGNARPSPPSIGAYDLVGAGGVVPLQPPTLIQLSTN